MAQNSDDGRNIEGGGEMFLSMLQIVEVTNCGGGGASTKGRKRWVSGAKT